MSNATDDLISNLYTKEYKYFRRVLDYKFPWLSKEEKEDLIQEMFICLVKKGEELLKIESLRAFADRTVRNLAINLMVAKNSKGGKKEMGYKVIPIDSIEQVMIASVPANQLDDLVKNEQLDSIYCKIKRYKKKNMFRRENKFKDFVVAVEDMLNGYSHEEISKKRKITLNRSRKLLTMGIKVLKYGKTKIYESRK